MNMKANYYLLNDGEKVKNIFDKKLLMNCMLILCYMETDCSLVYEHFIQYSVCYVYLCICMLFCFTHKKDDFHIILLEHKKCFIIIIFLDSRFYK